MLPKTRLLRGFGALTVGGVCGAIVSALDLAAQKEKKRPAIMSGASMMCAVFAGLCWKGYQEK